MSTLVAYEPHVNQAIELFCTRLAERAGTRETIDIAEFFQYYAFDVIGVITVTQKKKKKGILGCPKS